MKRPSINLHKVLHFNYACKGMEKARKKASGLLQPLFTHELIGNALLPLFSPLQVVMSSKPTEVRAFGSQLLAASKLIGKYCDDVNDEFILCKAEYDNPVHCIKVGRRVTECALGVYVLSSI